MTIEVCVCKTCRCPYADAQDTLKEKRPEPTETYSLNEISALFDQRAAATFSDGEIYLHLDAVFSGRYRNTVVTFHEVCVNNGYFGNGRTAQKYKLFQNGHN